LAESKRKQAATNKLKAKASVESRARRAAFNASKSGKTNLLGKNELVDDVASGKVDLSAIDKDQLPEPIQNLPAAEQKRVIEEKSEQRKTLLSEITTLSKKRTDFLGAKVKEKGGAKDSLDNQIYDTVRQQALEKGLRYEAAAPSY
jgi:hypothetical protein